MARICLIRQGYLQLDPRVRREVEALVSAGHEVDVICLRFGNEPRFERDGKVRTWRLPPKHRRLGGLRYAYEYLAFLLLAGSLLTALHLRHPYDLVQVNTLPDTLVFAAAVAKALGARVLLDLHECSPEFYASKYSATLQHPRVRAVAALEQASIRFSHAAITCTEPMREAFIGRGAPSAKVNVVLNGADESVFDPERFARTRPPDDNRFILFSHGTVEERYGLDTAIRAVALLKGRVDGLELQIYGHGSYRPELQRLAKELGVEDCVHFSGEVVPIDDLVQALANCDVGVVAIKRDACRDLALCNKMYEFIAMRKPAIVSRTRSVERYFDDSCFRMFNADDADDLAKAVLELRENPALAHRLVEAAFVANGPSRWPRQRAHYITIVEELIQRRGEGPLARPRRDSAPPAAVHPVVSGSTRWRRGGRRGHAPR